MRFRYMVEVEVKNDAGSHEMDNNDLALMIMGLLENNKLGSVPWVIAQNYELVKE